MGGVGSGPTLCDSGKSSHHLLVQAVQDQPKELLCILLTALQGVQTQEDMCVCVWGGGGRGCHIQQYDLVFMC